MLMFFCVPRGASRSISAFWVWRKHETRSTWSPLGVRPTRLSGNALSKVRIAVSPMLAAIVKTMVPFGKMRLTDSPSSFKVCVYVVIRPPRLGHVTSLDERNQAPRQERGSFLGRCVNLPRSIAATSPSRLVPMLRHRAKLRLLQRHMRGLREGDRAIGEEVIKEALLELARGGQHPLARLLRPLHRPQHRRNPPADLEARNQEQEVRQVGAC